MTLMAIILVLSGTAFGNTDAPPLPLDSKRAAQQITRDTRATISLLAPTSTRFLVEAVEAGAEFFNNTGGQIPGGPSGYAPAAKAPGKAFQGGGGLHAFVDFVEEIAFDSSTVIVVIPKPPFLSVGFILGLVKRNFASVRIANKDGSQNVFSVFLLILPGARGPAATIAIRNERNPLKSKMRAANIAFVVVILIS